MAQPENEARHQALLEKVPPGYLYYPLLFVNGELKSAGSVEYYDVLYAVRDLLGVPAVER